MDQNTTQTSTRASHKKVNGYNSAHLWAKRNRKKSEAIDRQKKYDGLSLTEKIKLVTNRGGSKKELARLKKEQADISKS